MKTKYIAIVLSLLLFIFLSGCASNPEVKILADKTAANVGTISVHLQRLSENSREIAEKRAANISRLNAANAELRARYEYDIELTKMSDDGSNLKLIDNIKAWGQKVDEIFDKAAAVEIEHKKKVLATQKTLDVKSKSLAEIAQSLATIAKEEKSKDRIRFLKDYAKSLKNELDERLKKDDKTAKDANALINKVKKDI